MPTAAKHIQGNCPHLYSKHTELCSKIALHFIYNEWQTPEILQDIFSYPTHSRCLLVPTDFSRRARNKGTATIGIVVLDGMKAHTIDTSSDVFHSNKPISILLITTFYKYTAAQHFCVRVLKKSIVGQRRTSDVFQ